MYNSTAEVMNAAAEAAEKLARNAYTETRDPFKTITMLTVYSYGMITAFGSFLFAMAEEQGRDAKTEDGSTVDIVDGANVLLQNLEKHQSLLREAIERTASQIAANEGKLDSEARQELMAPLKELSMPFVEEAFSTFFRLQKQD